MQVPPLGKAIVFLGGLRITDLFNIFGANEIPQADGSWQVQMKSPESKAFSHLPGGLCNHPGFLVGFWSRRGLTTMTQLVSLPGIFCLPPQAGHLDPSKAVLTAGK